MLPPAYPLTTDVMQMQPGFAEVVKVGECTQQGQEIPADVMATLLSLRVNDDDCTENGWLLDGYPREKHHSEALVKAGLVPSKIIVMKVPEQVLIDNQCHRRIDPEVNLLPITLPQPPCPNMA